MPVASPPSRANLFAFMPLLFGLGFIAPLLLQTGFAAILAGWLGVAPLGLALAIGGGWGGLACLRGRWL